LRSPRTGSPLRALRRALDLRQSDLAALAGIHAEHVSRLERGLCSPTLKTARSLAAALNCEIEAIFPEHAGKA
jgi:transcriptional regulator with XRE-family HTH domain